MGIDFIRQAAKSFHKGLDRRRVELATPTLFTRDPSAAPRTYAADIRPGQCLTAGEKLCVRLDGQRVVATRGLDPIATVASPSDDLVAALSACHGEACGTVEHVHETAGVAEISVC